jgi:predicted nucleic acid-binding protein
MRRASDGRILVVSDTSGLINFLRAGRFDLVSRHKEYKVVITEHVRNEVSYPDQKTKLEAALSAGDIEETTLTDPAELELFAELNAVLGRGESAAIAVAANRGWVIATDELGRTRRAVHERVGHNRLINTSGWILTCIRNGALTVAEAAALKDDLQAQGQSFPLAFDSFSELL